MPVVPGLTTTVPAGRPYHRITSLSFLTAQTTHHKKVVNGDGAIRSSHGARYITPARKFRMLLHTNPTRERGECLGTRAGAWEDM